MGQMNKILKESVDTIQNETHKSLNAKSAKDTETETLYQRRKKKKNGDKKQNKTLKDKESMLNSINSVTKKRRARVRSKRKELMQGNL